MSSAPRPRVSAVSLALLALGTASCGAPEDGLGSLAQGIQQCPSNTVEGIDVYDGSGTIDWAAARGDGIQWASIKATQGTYNTQSRFATNRANAHAQGIYVARYHFFDPTEDGNAQASHFLSVVGSLGALDLPAVLDVECPDGDAHCLGSTSGAGPTPDEIRTRMLDFLTAVESATGKTPIIYTFGSYFSSNGIDTTGLDHYPLWIAYPTVTTSCGTGGTCFNVPAPWTSAVMWQWTWVGCVSGLSGDVDRDRFIGTLADLQALAAGGPQYAARYVAQSWPLASQGPLQMTAGQEVQAWIELRNAGTATWDANTRLATTVPRDRASPLAGPDWVQPDRPAQVSGSVAPGETFRFAFTFRAPAQPGTYDEHFGVVEDGVAWFSDPGQGGPPDEQIEAIIEVTAAPDAGTVDAGTGVGDGGSARDAGSASDAGRGDAGTGDARGDVLAGDAALGDAGGGHAGGGCACSAAGTRARGNAAARWGAVVMLGIAGALGRKRARR